VSARVKPIASRITASTGTPVDLAVLNINCARPNGDVSIAVDPGSPLILLDNGLGPDQVSGDGVYSGQWIPPASGTYALTFPGGDVVTVDVLASYTYTTTTFNWRTITGTNLNLSDDSSAQIASPFPIRFAGGSFSSLFVSSNGSITFGGPFTAYDNSRLPTTAVNTLVAPFWDDFYPLPGTAQNVFWAVTGTAPNRELVVEWRDVRPYDCLGDGSATVKFQVVFFEGSSRILVNYGDVTFGGACAFADRGGTATVGVQVAPDPDRATEFSFNSATLSAGLALLWTTEATPPPALSVSPASQDFGSVTVGSSADRTFTVQNTGGQTLIGSAATLAPGFSILSGGPFNLAAGASQAVVVRFSPTAASPASGSVDFTSNAGTVPRAVTGTGTASGPALGVSPASQDFGTVPVGSSAYRTFTVQNTGGQTLTGSASTQAPGFSIVSGGSFSLAAGASQAVVVRFSPTAAGPVSGSVDFASNAGTVSRPVTGTASAVALTLQAPNGGETWTIGSNQTIRWSSSGVSGKIRIQLSRDGGVTWKTIFSGVGNSGSKSWKVTGPATSNARSRISSVRTPALVDMSDASFTIQ